MDFHRFNLRLWISVVFTAGALSAAAQSQSDGDSTIFSKPADDGMTSPATSPEMPDSLVPQGSAPAFNPGSVGLPPPTTDWQKPSNDHKEWTLMTPEEIMGVQTPEQIYGLPDKDKDLSPEQLYLNRERDTATATATNGMSGDNSWSRKTLDLLDRPDDNDSFSQQDKPEDSSTSRIFGGIYNKPQASPFDQKSHPSSFAPPSHDQSSIVKQDAEQQAEMDRFRALIGEVPLSGSPPPASPPPASPSLQPLSQFDPFGHPLIDQTRSNPSKPDELTALPQLAGSYTPVKKTKKPSWEPQAPPWLSDGSTPPNSPPVRKFY
jgi:hypothetical protein